MSDAHHLKVKLQVMCGDEIAMGPGKADLLEAIAAHGSISAAGRALGLSYRRAWLLVDTMNRCWALPLVQAKGGSAGAEVTAYGQQLLARYRRMQQAAEDATAAGWAEMGADLQPAPR